MIREKRGGIWIFVGGEGGGRKTSAFGIYYGESAFVGQASVKRGVYKFLHFVRCALA